MTRKAVAATLAAIAFWWLVAIAGIGLTVGLATDIYSLYLAHGWPILVGIGIMSVPLALGAPAAWLWINATSDRSPSS